MANFSVNNDFSTAESHRTAKVVPAVSGRIVAPVVAVEILRGRAKQRMRPVNVPVFLIGSADDCDLVLADNLFPDVHTYLYVTPRGVTLRQLGMTPPLYVDGEKVEVAALRNGETFRLGSSYEFRLHIDHRAPRVETDRQLRFDAGEPNHIPDPNGLNRAHALLADIREHLAQLPTAPASCRTLPRLLNQLQTRLTRDVA